MEAMAKVLAMIKFMASKQLIEKSEISLQPVNKESFDYKVGHNNGMVIFARYLVDKLPKDE